MTLTASSTYKALTEQQAIQLAHELGVFAPEAALQSEEIGDGNLNYVFRISDSANGQGLIIKQALPYAKVVGESWPLTLHRATIEANALKLHGKLAKGRVPKVYATDAALAVTVMEDLSHLTILRNGLIDGKHYPKLAEHIGGYLAHTLFHTSDFGLHPFEKKRLAAEFSNPELCKITEDLIFTDPFFDHETNDFEEPLREEVQAIWNNEPLKFEVAKLKRSFLTEAEALLHGDLHTGSIFVDEQQTKVIDPEFAFYGPIGFDIGLFLANLIVQAITRSGEERELIVQDITQTWQVFEEQFSSLWESDGIETYKTTAGYREYAIEKIFHDAIGFAGCELIRRTIGLAHVRDLDDIADESTRIDRKRQTLKAGEALIETRRSYHSIAELEAAMKELSK